MKPALDTPGSYPVGNRRPFGRRNRPGRHSALPVCSTGQSQAGGSADPRQRPWLPVHGDGRADHVEHPWRSLGSPVGRRRWYEEPLRGEPSQHRNRVATAFGEAGSSPPFTANEGDLRRSAFFPGLRYGLAGTGGGKPDAGRVTVPISSRPYGTPKRSSRPGDRVGVVSRIPV